MAKFFDEITDRLGEFIAAQKMFFVATAAETGRINLSPKGYDSLKILNPNRVLWLNLSGSGNETAAHLLRSNRLTLMFCAFEDAPMILRVYGSARAIHPRDSDWETLASHFSDFPGARQLFDVTVESVQTSCGFGVPLYDYQGERDKLLNHYRAKGPVTTQEGWRQKNTTSIDGLPTGIVETPDPN